MSSHQNVIKSKLIFFTIINANIYKKYHISFTKDKVLVIIIIGCDVNGYRNAVNNTNNNYH